MQVFFFSFFYLWFFIEPQLPNNNKSFSRTNLLLRSSSYLSNIAKMYQRNSLIVLLSGFYNFYKAKAKAVCNSQCGRKCSLDTRLPWLFTVYQNRTEYLVSISKPGNFSGLTVRNCPNYHTMEIVTWHLHREKE